MSPDTAADTLKLLHELQVHQVELDLQEEELRRSVAELESALFGSVQLYDFAPAACSPSIAPPYCSSSIASVRACSDSRRMRCWVAPSTASWKPDSSRALRAVLLRVADGAEGEGCELHFVAREGVSGRPLMRPSAPTPPANAF